MGGCEPPEDRDERHCYKICLFHLPRMGVVGVSVVVAAAAGISKKDSSCKEIMGEI